MLQRSPGRLLQDKGAQLAQIGHGPDHGKELRRGVGSFGQRLQDLQGSQPALIAIDLEVATACFASGRQRFAGLKGVPERRTQLRAVAGRFDGLLLGLPLARPQLRQQQPLKTVQRPARHQT